MSSQVNIRIPPAFAKKPKATNGDTKSNGNSNKWANKRTTNLMVFDSNNGMSSKLEETKSKIDSNNVPYAWKSKHVQEKNVIETFTRKQKFKHDGRNR